MRALTPLLLAALLLGGCSALPFVGGKDKEKEQEGYTEEDFQRLIERNLNANRWEDAIENLKALEAQFPFGAFAEQAQLSLIYAYHRAADYENAIAAADRFIRLHPRHPNVDYAYYLKGLSQLSQSRSFLGGFLPVDVTQRDPASAREAFATFGELITLLPESPYARDARKRMLHLRNLLARYEIHVANHYFARGAYLAAANRGRYVVENFQGTPAVPDALAVMAEAYHLLGKEDLAEDAVRVLAANYPDYPSLDDRGRFRFQGVAPDEGRRWLRIASLGLYDDRRAPHYDTRWKYNPEPGEKKPETPREEKKRSLFRILTLGLFD
ncbi:MAG: outer membrane protein assembly factor BamD [Porticoccaceae bacterium]|nr:MAG: outer membrane protein assembly factor BamD [Porticoccaceae bacterium]